MFRFINLAAIAITLVAAVLLFRVKYEATDFASEVAKLRTDIVSERAQINVLKAEWNFLNEPRRIQRLADQYLDLQNMDAHQIVTFQELSARLGRQESLQVERSLDEFTGSVTAPEQ
ncbi:MAG: hypothetical protein JKY32_09485 [Rhizobiales bacterium]|nr:hypothetical protein [Hyphomicrobiales bacterium]